MSSYFLRLSSEKQNLCVKGYTGFIFEYLIPDHSLKELLIYCPTNNGRERLFPHTINTEDFQCFKFLSVLIGKMCLMFNLHFFESKQD